jgi:hypothetical protein
VSFKPAAEVEREYGLRPGSLTSYQQPNLWTCYPESRLDRDRYRDGDPLYRDWARRLTQARPARDWKEEAFVQSEMSIALFKLGYALVSFCADHANLDEPPTRRTGYPTVDELLHLTTGRPTVFVIQKPGLEHAIAKTVDGVIIDPSTGKEYADEYPLKTIEISFPSGGKAMDRKTDRNLAWCLFIMGMMILWLLADVWSDGWHTAAASGPWRATSTGSWSGRAGSRPGKPAEIFRQHEAAQRKK